jgi:hypothetical protein
MKYFATLLLLIGFSFLVNGQDSNQLQIIPFDEEQFNQKFPDPNQFDSLELFMDTLALNTQNPYPMRIIEVPENQMAPMPNMPIRDDIHYHMRIKRYHNYYAPEPQQFEYKLLPDQKNKVKEESGGKE